MRGLLLLFLFTPLILRAQTLKVFLLTGQSNSLGTLATSDDSMQHDPPGSHSAEKGEVPFYWDNRADGTPTGDAALGSSGGAWVNLGPQTGGYYAGNDDHWGPEIGFARMLSNAGYEDFAIVKASRGGGGNSFWVKGSPDDHMYDHLLATAQAAVATLPPGYSSYEFAGLLYIQGESNDATEADEAGTRFAALLDNLKADLSEATNLKGLLGEIGGGSSANRNLTRERQSDLAASRSDVGYAASVGTNQHDGLHYSADSQLLLGERLAAEAIATGALGSEPLPRWANLYAWYVADNATTPDSSGLLQRWASLAEGSGAHDLTRSVSGRPNTRRVTTTNGAAREVVAFDGQKDLWASSGEFGPLDGDRTVAVLCRIPSGSEGFLFDGSTFSGRTRARVLSGQWQAGVSSSTWNATEPVTTTLLPDSWQRHVWTFTNTPGGTQISHWIDGVETTVTDSETLALRGLILGSNGGNPFLRLSCEVAEVAVYNESLTALEIAELDAFWQSRWGQPSGPPAEVRVAQTSQEIPRFGLHPLLAVEIDQPDNSDSLQSIQLTLKPGMREHLACVKLISNGNSPEFNASANTIASVSEPSTDTLTFTIDESLSEGTNFFWIAIEPRRWAPLGQNLDATIDSVILANTTHAVTEGDPSGELTLGLVPLFSDIRRSGDFGITTYRIPGIACSPDGVLHTVFDHRWTGGADLPADVDVGYSRSTDGGATWSGYQPIMDYDKDVPGSSGNGVGDPCILYDPATNTLWVAALWSFGNNGYNGSGAGTDPAVTGQYVLTKSTDGGDTWSPPINITVDVKADPNWRLIFQGPGHGLVMRDGTLVFPSQYRDASGTVRVCSVFSSDQGATWDFGSGVPTSNPQTNENTVCELDDGRLLFSMRTPSGSNGQRAWIHYTPGGANPMKDGSWDTLFRLPSVPDPVCQGSVIQWTSTHRGAPRERIAFINPASSSSRTNLTLRISGDGGDSWPVSRLVYGGPSAYSALCTLPDGTLGMIFEKDNYTRLTFVRIEEDWLWNPDVDADSDQLPDAWEAFHGTNPSLDDATADPDNDGSNNLQEYQNGTDPQASASVFQINCIEPVGPDWSLSWQSVPGRSYTIQTSPDLSSWTSLSQLVADSANTSFPLSGTPEKLFVRVSTP